MYRQGVYGLAKLRSALTRPVRSYRSTPQVYGYLSDGPSGNSSRVSPIPANELGSAHLRAAYRTYAHRKAHLDPLGIHQPGPIKELDPSLYGLSESSPEVRGLVESLEAAYCGTLAAEFAHLETAEEREWFAAEFEGLHARGFSAERRLAFAKLMLQGQNFDHYLARKFASVKRYGGEGCEAALAAYWQLLCDAPTYGVSDVVLCMAHRGRLNLLTQILEFPVVAMFHKMLGHPEFPAAVEGMGDVLSHLTSSVRLDVGEGHSVHASLLPNPSHLEAVNPAAVGKARARLESLAKGEYAADKSAARSGDGVLCVQIHGDAAFTGQGIVAETLQLSQLAHFAIGGSVHIILNNQIGYTTQAERGRSSRSCADLAKAAHCPVIHVNGDHPEEVAKSVQLAQAYRDRFRRDVFVNLVCFRRWGHNELDDPSFTQPTMYDVISDKATVPDQYALRLISEGLLSESQKNEWLSSHNAELDTALSQVDSYEPKAKHLESRWAGLSQAPAAAEDWETGVDLELLRYVAARSVQTPSEMAPHPHLAKMHCGVRRRKLEAGEPLDWSTAEAAALGSLLLQGFGVRISGQDVGRGTFSQRHAMLVDHGSDHLHIPLNELSPDQTAFLEVVNSPLSEEAVLAFEWGMSIESVRRLVIWEAQFGDFFNGAQIIIDTFIASGETKWLTQSGLVMLLPHGFDGAGPEHSSARIERFLQLTDSKEAAVDGDNVNMGVVNPTTSAQYFHLLRRQMVRPYRKPLVVASPKVLLRFPGAASTLADMGPGTAFRPVLPDSHRHADPAKVTRVILCSGKHFFTLRDEREARGLTETTAILRLEALCPFPTAALRAELAAFPAATAFVWAQEEPRNAGAWPFAAPRLGNLLGLRPSYAGRPELPAAASAIAQVHNAQAKELLAQAFA